MSQTVIHGSLKATPHQHPQGMRVAGLLKSELFGLRSTVDSETLRRMDRRNLGPVALEEMDFFGRNARFVLAIISSTTIFPGSKKVPLIFSFFQSPGLIRCSSLPLHIPPILTIA